MPPGRVTVPAAGGRRARAGDGALAARRERRRGRARGEDLADGAVDGGHGAVGRCAEHGVVDVLLRRGHAPACATATSPAAARSATAGPCCAESRLFCAVTTPCRAFSTWTRPAASSTCDAVPRGVQRRPAGLHLALGLGQRRLRGGRLACTRSSRPPRTTTRASRQGCPRPAARPRGASGAPPRTPRRSRRRPSQPEHRREQARRCRPTRSTECPRTPRRRPRPGRAGLRRRRGCPRRSRAASSRGPRRPCRPSTVASVWPWVGVEDLARLVRGVLRARHGGGVDQPVQRGLLGGELALLLFEHAPQLRCRRPSRARRPRRPSGRPRPRRS